MFKVAVFGILDNSSGQAFAFGLAWMSRVRKALDVLTDRLDPSAEIRNEVSKFLKGFDALKGVEIQCCPTQRPARARECPIRRCHANAVASHVRF